MNITLARPLAVAVLTLGVAVLAAGPAKAQALPPGSYQRSCTQLHWSGTTLVAECSAHEGRMTGTGLANANRCVGDIWNDNGQLRCNYAGGPIRGPEPQQGYGPPPGPGPGYGGYDQPGYSGYDERRARCEELWRRQNGLRDRIQYTWGPERERLEERLRDIHADRERLGCRW